MAGKMTWSSEKVERDLAPVFKRLNETKVQSTLESYFAVDGTAQTSSSAKQSKRMKSAIRMLKNKSSSSQLAKPEEPNLSEDEVEEQQKKTPAGESNGASKTATTSRAKKGDTISTTSKSKPKSAPRRKKTTWTVVSLFHYIHNLLIHFICTIFHIYILAMTVKKTIY